MLASLLLVSLVHAGEPSRLETFLAGSRASLSQPDGVLWDEGEAGFVLLSGPWRGGCAARGVDRYDIRDGEIRVHAGGEHARWGWEAGASRGSEEVFLPTWSFWNAFHAPFAKRWDAGLSHKSSVYPDFLSVLPEVSVDFFPGNMRLGARANLPVADGIVLDPGWQFLSEYSWSDDGSVRWTISGASEAEPSAVRKIVETRVHASALSLRQRFKATTLRCGVSWTRQGDFHDRWGADLGISHAFAL